MKRAAALTAVFLAGLALALGGCGSGGDDGGGGGAGTGGTTTDSGGYGY